VGRGQNLALNVAEKGFTISVYNRSYDKTVAAESRAKKEGVLPVECVAIVGSAQRGACAGLGDNLHGFETIADFVASLEKPRYDYRACRCGLVVLFLTLCVTGA
jgi:6-phosphogluconate dehydrogenase